MSLIIGFFLVVVVPFTASILTFLSGFGLNTILLPAFIVLFPIKIAIALTAIVHFLNNLFKLVLIGKSANLKVVALFGIPAVVAAWGGARLLSLLSFQQPIFLYSIGDKIHRVTILTLTIGVLMIAFALLELVPYFAKWKLDKKFLPLGGLLSGFFGGLSGHQGAFRSIFLLKIGLSKEAFVATGIVVACAVDAVRLSAYGLDLHLSSISHREFVILGIAVVSAWAGAYLGRTLLHITELSAIRWIVGVLLMILGLLIGSGVLG